MITRVLPYEEWPRLVGTELEQAVPHLNPEHAEIVVVEDEGQIVGCWMLMRCVHVEGVWIAPTHRKSGSVARRLIKAVWGIAENWGARSVVTGAQSDQVRGLLKHFDAILLPGEQYVVPLNTKGWSTCRSDLQ